MSTQIQPGDRSAAFVRRAHRRRVTWRMLEHAGIGLLVACAIAFVATTLLAWRGTDSISAIVPTTILLALGAACGAVAGVRRHPSVLDTASELDRQLRSPDLLSTALLISREQRFTDPGFVTAVLNQSDARVSGVSLADLSLRRFTSRAWGGVGLATAAALTFALMMTAVPPTASNAGSPGTNDRSVAGELSRTKAASREATGRATLPQQPDPTANRDRPDEDSEQHDDARRSDPRRTATAAGSARGDGAARTDDLRETRVPSSASVSKANPTNDASRGASPEGGVGRQTMANEAGETPGGLVARDPSAAHPAAPWSATSWPANQSAARDALQSGQVPAAYRDLVKDYFDLN